MAKEGGTSMHIDHRPLGTQNPADNWSRVPKLGWRDRRHPALVAGTHMPLARSYV